MSLCLIDSAKVRRFGEIGKYLADFLLKLWRQMRPSATKRWRDGRIVSQKSVLVKSPERFVYLWE